MKKIAWDSVRLLNMFSDVFSKIFFAKTVENFQPICCVVSSKFTIFFLQSSCFRVLFFLVPFIDQLSLDPFVEKIPQPLLVEKLSRTNYWNPQVSEKLKNQLVCKTNNAALVPFGKVSIFGHSVWCIKKRKEFCCQTSDSTKVRFFFISFSKFFLVVETKNYESSAVLPFSRCTCWKKIWKTPNRFFKFEVSFFV